jgi:hypothetical protein
MRKRLRLVLDGRNRKEYYLPTLAARRNEMNAKTSLAKVLAGLSEKEALAIYNALSQWADNERNTMDEMDEVDAEQESAVSAIEAVVEKCEMEIAKLAE